MDNKYQYKISWITTNGVYQVLPFKHKNQVFEFLELLKKRKINEYEIDTKNTKGEWVEYSSKLFPISGEIWN